MTETVPCTRCDTALPTRARFCFTCGTASPAHPDAKPPPSPSREVRQLGGNAIECGACNARLVIGLAFCPDCGVRLTMPAAPSQLPQAQPPRLPQHRPVAPGQPTQGGQNLVAIGATGAAILLLVVIMAVMAKLEEKKPAKVSESSVGTTTIAATPPDPCPGGWGEYDVFVECQKHILDQLTAPASAKFPRLINLPEGSIGRGNTSENACDLAIVTYVDSQNAFGAMLRGDFLCHYSYATKKVLALPLDNERARSMRAAFRE